MEISIYRRWTLVFSVFLMQLRYFISVTFRKKKKGFKDTSSFRGAKI